MRWGKREEGDDEQELNDGSGEGKREEGSWKKKGRTDIYRRRQSLASVSSGCSEAHLSVFFKIDTVLQLIVFRSPFATIILSLSLPLTDWVTLCLQAKKRMQPYHSLCSTLIVFTKHRLLCPLVLLYLWGPGVGFYHNTWFANTKAKFVWLNYIFWKFKVRECTVLMRDLTSTTVLYNYSLYVSLSEDVFLQE